MIVRPMTTTDADAVATLSKQLGYPVTPALIAERLALISRRPDNGFFVAERGGGAVVGWVHVYGVPLLESPQLFVEIGGLVVDAGARRQGIGRALMAQAEQWARAHGYFAVHLRSGMHRTEAHEFYQSLGYEITKTSRLFRKAIL